MTISNLIACVSCNPELQAALFKSSSGVLLAKLMLPPLITGFGIYYYQSSSQSFQSGIPVTAKPVVAFSVLLGLGLGGFTDGILLHQILQWHQMISFALPPDTLEAKNINMFWDGIFHVITWSITLAGVLLMWRSMKRNDLLLSNMVFAGGLVTGWGIFNFLDSIFNHYLFRFHNVRENVANPEYWNLGFLLFSLLLMGCGYLMIKAGTRKHTPPATTQTSQ